MGENKASLSRKSTIPQSGGSTVGAILPPFSCLITIWRCYVLFSSFMFGSYEQNSKVWAHIPISHHATQCLFSGKSIINVATKTNHFSTYFHTRCNLISVHPLKCVQNKFSYWTYYIFPTTISGNPTSRRWIRKFQPWNSRLQSRVWKCQQRTLVRVR